VYEWRRGEERVSTLNNPIYEWRRGEKRINTAPIICSLRVGRRGGLRRERRHAVNRQAATVLLRISVGVKIAVSISVFVSAVGGAWRDQHLMQFKFLRNKQVN